MEKKSKIFIAGHKGLVGSAIHRRLLKEGYANFVLRTSKELDLRDQSAVETFFGSEKPEYVFLAAAKVGGIYANSHYQAEFIRDNLMIQTNVIHQAYVSGVKKLLFLGSSCIYPKNSPQPIVEGALLTSPLEATNQPYAIAKIAGIEMCKAYRQQYNCNFISLMPTNLYGPNDNYDPLNSHVLPALIKKFQEAKEENRQVVEVWGSGTPRREFLHVDDLADACLFLMNNYNSSEIINVGTGVDLTIKELAVLIKNCVGFEGELSFDVSQPDGTPQKKLDISKIVELGWRPKISLAQGVEEVCREFADRSTEAFLMEEEEYAID
jgi:GDP-L-fucose synthase